MEYFNCPFEVKAHDMTPAGFVAGYGSVFNVLDMQADVVAPGAFKATIKENPRGWPMLFGHEMAKCCGFWTTAREDSRGLYLEGEFTLESPEGASAAAIVRHGLKLGHPFGLSIGYKLNPGGWKMEGDIRKLTSISLLEVSVVSVPANQESRVVACKSDDPSVLRNEAYRVLKEKGFSRRQIEHILAAGSSQPEPPPAQETKQVSIPDIAAAFRDAKVVGARRRAYLEKVLDPPRPPKANWIPYDYGLADGLLDQCRDERIKVVEDAIAGCKTTDEIVSALYSLGFKDEHVGYMRKAGFCEP